MIFSFVVRYLNFLKGIYPLPFLFDIFLMIFTWVFKNEIYKTVTHVDQEVSAWPGMNVTLHKFGGFQFNLNGREIGHMHSNGVVDILFDLQTKKVLLGSYRLEDHH